MSDELRCGNCNFWLGESSEPLVYVDTVPKWDPATDGELKVRKPRDLRLCKKCEHVNIYVPKSLVRNLLTRSA